MEGLCFSVSSSSLFVLVTVTGFFLQALSVTYWGDVEVLRQLKVGLDPTSVSQGSCLSSWDFEVDPCDNLYSQKFTCGFRCDTVTSNLSRVTEIALDQAGYSGSLASVSWNLPFLQTLDLSNNYFNGPIPASVSNLTALRRLSLSRNSFSDSIPISLGSIASLEELYLDNNNLQGTIPSTLNGLVNLKRLEIQGNKISGEFPDLGEIGNLYFLDASDNSISGELPAEFPATLVQISMRGNQIEGNIPASVTNLSYLQVLDLSHNELNGSVPASLLSHPSLEQLTLSYNRFGWIHEPKDSGMGSQLIAVDLSNNELIGSLPGFMGTMPKLSALSLENNKISGVIPIQYALKLSGGGAQVGSVSPFERLLLGGNYLVGAIPGPLLELKPGWIRVSLGNNCFYRCPRRFFFCEGGQQKPLTECKPLIP